MESKNPSLNNGMFPNWKEYKAKALEQWTKAHPAPFTEDELVELVNPPTPAIRITETNAEVIIVRPKSGNAGKKHCLLLLCSETGNSRAIEMTRNDLAVLIQALCEFEDDWHSYCEFEKSERVVWEKQYPLMQEYSGRRGTFVSDLKKEYELDRAIFDAERDGICLVCHSSLEAASGRCLHCESFMPSSASKIKTGGIS